jgi:hypothetical protein
MSAGRRAWAGGAGMRWCARILQAAVHADLTAEVHTDLHAACKDLRAFTLSFTRVRSFLQSFRIIVLIIIGRVRHLRNSEAIS